MRKHRLLRGAMGMLCAFHVVCAADFEVKESELKRPVSIIAYGDMRFTDPANVSATNPKARRWLVEKITEEQPAAVLLSGDVPWHGADKNDYAVFNEETRPWRQAHLRIYPALGNHELNGNPNECIQNWWSAFPELHGRRWYSVKLGDHIYVLNIDSNSSLAADGEQHKWIRRELASVPDSIQWVFVNLHHPPVSDFQEHGDASHNVRLNERVLADMLARLSLTEHMRIIVTAGHVHNYERFLKGGVVYLVSGGGGAKPRPVIRTTEDLYQSSDFPNYHYVKFVANGGGLDGTMIRLKDADAAVPLWEEKDHFQVQVASNKTLQ
jgi:acid phosphatase type 7